MLRVLVNSQLQEEREENLTGQGQFCGSNESIVWQAAKGVKVNLWKVKRSTVLVGNPVNKKTICYALDKCGLYEATSHVENTTNVEDYAGVGPTLNLFAYLQNH